MSAVNPGNWPAPDRSYQRSRRRSNPDQPNPRAPGINRLHAIRQRRDFRAALAQALALRGKQVRLLRHQREPGEPCCLIVALAGALALPDIHAEVMVIAPRRQERSTAA